MLRCSHLRITATVLLLLPLSAVHAQQSPTHPPDYRGVQTFIPGVFVTPVPNAPFSATVELSSKEILPDGTSYVRTGSAHIARSSAGVIYNERRRMMPSGTNGEPAILSWHIYDPNTHLSTFLNPQTHIARQWTIPRPQAPENSTPDNLRPIANAQTSTTRDLGMETIAGVPLHGTRKLRTIPAPLSGTGHDLTITDDYWYSEELKVYLVMRHNDPRTGEQIIAITKVDRQEPDPAVFKVPPGFKIADETPPSE